MTMKRVQKRQDVRTAPLVRVRQIDSPVKASMSAYYAAKHRAKAVLDGALIIMGPLFAPSAKPRSKRGWTTKKAA